MKLLETLPLMILTTNALKLYVFTFERRLQDEFFMSLLTVTRLAGDEPSVSDRMFLDFEVDLLTQMRPEQREAQHMHVYLGHQNGQVSGYNLLPTLRTHKV